MMFARGIRGSSCECRSQQGRNQKFHFLRGGGVQYWEGVDKRVVKGHGRGRGDGNFF